MRGYRPGYFASPELANPAEERAKDRARRIPVYARRARAGLPLFEEPGEETAIPVRVVVGSRGGCGRCCRSVRPARHARRCMKGLADSEVSIAGRWDPSDRSSDG